MVAKRASRVLGHRDSTPSKTSGYKEPEGDRNEVQAFGVGQRILSADHGVGEIIAMDKVEIAGENVELLVINFAADDMTLRVPAAKAASLGIRILPSLAEDMSPAPPLVPAPRAQADILDALQRHGFSDDELFELVIPKRTLARRRAEGDLLTVEETDKAFRLQRIAALAQRVFGDREKAHRWLRKPKRQLTGETPMAYLASESGARVVEEMLYRIDHGMAA